MAQVKGEGATSVAPDPTIQKLTKTEARALTDEVKADAQSLWRKLLQLYEGDAHIALGFTSWGAYYSAEFGEVGSRGYHLLDSARVLRELESRSTNCRTDELPTTESVARELKSLADEPEEMAEAWSEAVEEHGPKPTAKQVRAKVRKRKAPSTNGSAPPTPQAAAKPKAKPKSASVVQGRKAVSHDHVTVSWVRDRYAEGWTREQIVEASRNKTDGWPRTDVELTNGGVSEIRAVIVALERQEGLLAKRAARETKSKKALKEFWALRKGGDLPLLAETAKEIMTMTSKLMMVNLESFDLGHISAATDMEKLAEALAEFQQWVEIVTAFVDVRVSEKHKREIIRHMREDTQGMDEHELASSLRFADKLERKLEGKRALKA